jgi:hypothetical protein
MPYSRVSRVAIVAAAAIVSTVAAGTPALAAGGDTTAPTPPYLIYAQGY